MTSGVLAPRGAGDVELLRESTGELFTSAINTLAITDSGDDGAVQFCEIDDLWDDYSAGDDGDVEMRLVLHGHDAAGSEGVWAVSGWQLSDLVGYMLGSESTADQSNLFIPVAVDPGELGGELL